MYGDHSHSNDGDGAKLCSHSYVDQYQGTDRCKLELILQSFVAEEWDGVFIIDIELDQKGGD